MSHKINLSRILLVAFSITLLISSIIAGIYSTNSTKQFASSPNFNGIVEPGENYTLCCTVKTGTTFEASGDCVEKEGHLGSKKPGDLAGPNGYCPSESYTMSNGWYTKQAACNPANWFFTSEWSSCSAACGAGTQSRTRQNECGTSETIYHACNTQACPPVEPPVTDPEITIDESSIFLVQDGFACGIGSAFDNDGLSIQVTNWQTSYTTQGRFFTAGGTFGSWFTLGSPTVTGTSASLFLQNSSNSPAGLAGWQVRVLNSSNQQVGNTASLNYTIITDQNDPVCGGSGEVIPIEMSIGFEITQTTNDQTVGSCPVVTSDRSRNNGNSSLQVIKWSYVPEATQYRVTGYRLVSGNFVAYTPYLLPNIATNFTSEVFLEVFQPQGIVKYTTFATQPNTYAYFVEALDASSNVLGSTQTVSASHTCTFTVSLTPATNQPSVISNLSISPTSSPTSNLLSDTNNFINDRLVVRGEIIISANFVDPENNLMQLSFGHLAEAPNFSHVIGNLGSNISNGSYSWNFFETGTQSDGNSMIRIQSVDGILGNPALNNIVSQNTLIIIDNTAPIVSSITPMLPSTISTTTLNLSADISDNIGLRSVGFEIVGQPSVNSCTETSGGNSTLANQTFACNFNLSTLTAGQYTLRISSLDKAGNSTQAESTFTYNPIVDLQTPVQLGWNIQGSSESSTTSIYPNTLPVDISCEQLIRFTNVNSVAFNWTTADSFAGLKFQREVTYPNGNIGYFYSNSTHTSFATFGGNPGTEGVWTNRVRSYIDYNGNNILDNGEPVSNWSSTCSIIFDRTATVSTFSSPIDGQIFTTTIPLVGTTTDNFSVDHVMLQYRVSATTAWTTITTIHTPAVDLTTFDWSFNWTPPASGTYDFKVYGIDTAGNIEASDYVYDVIFDNGSPIVSIGNGNSVAPTQNMPYLLAANPSPNLPAHTSPTHQSVVSGQLSVFATIQDTDGIEYFHFRVVREGSIDSPIGCDITQSGYDICDDSRFAFNLYGSASGSNFLLTTIDTAQLPNGNYWLILGAEDINGNRSATDFNHDVRIRIVVNNSEEPFVPEIPEGITLTHPSLSCGSITSSGSVTVVWNLSAGANWYNLFYETPGNGIPAELSRSLIFAENTYTYHFNQGDGTYRFRVRASADGINFSDWSEWCNVSFNTETPDPTVTIDESALRLVGGVACGIADMITDDMLRVVVTNWNSNFTLQGSYYQSGGSYNDWFELTNGTMGNGAFITVGNGAVYMWINNIDWQAGSASWRVRLLDENDVQISSVQSINFEVTTDPTHPACGQDPLQNEISATDLTNMVVNEAETVASPILATSSSLPYLVMQSRYIPDGVDATTIPWTDVYTAADMEAGSLIAGDNYDMGGVFFVADTSEFDEGIYQYRYYVFNAQGHISNSGYTDYVFNGVSAYFFSIEIRNVTPQVSLSASSIAVQVNQSVNFTGSFTDPSYIISGNVGGTPDDAPWTITINYGDGTLLNLGTMALPGNVTIPNHSYSNPGSYTVTATVQENTNQPGEGEIGTAQVTINVSEQTLQPLGVYIISSSGLIQNAPASTNLTAVAQNASGAVTYSWSGSCTGTVQSITLNMPTASSYPCSVTIQDQGGRVASASVILVANQVANPQSQLSVTIVSSGGTNVVAPTSSVMSLNIQNGSGTYSYNWGGNCMGTASTTTLTINNAGVLTCNVSVVDLSTSQSATATLNIVATSTQTHDEQNNNGTGQSGGPISFPTNNNSNEQDNILGQTGCRVENERVISGFVFVDENKDGAFDDGEIALKGVQIRLTGRNGSIIGISVTNQDGRYNFSACPGNYSLLLEKADIPTEYVLANSESRDVSLGNSDIRNFNFAVIASDAGLFAGLNWWLCLIPLCCLLLILGLAGLITLINRDEVRTQEIIYRSKDGTEMKMQEV